MMSKFLRLFTLVSILLLGLSMIADAQVKLSLDRFGRKPNLYFHKGDEILVRLKGQRKYTSLYIKEIYPEANAINTQHGLIQLDQVERLRVYRNKKGALFKILFGSLVSGSGSALLYSVVAWLFYGWSISWLTIGLMAMVSVLIWLYFKSRNRKTYRIGKRRKLRVIDMRIEQVEDDGL